MNAMNIIKHLKSAGPLLPVLNRYMIAICSFAILFMPNISRTSTPGQNTVVIEGLLIQTSPQGAPIKLRNRVIINGCPNEQLSLNFSGDIDQFLGNTYATLTREQIKGIGTTGCLKGRYTLDTSAYSESNAFSRTDTVNTRQIFPIIEFTCTTTSKNLENEEPPSC